MKFKLKSVKTLKHVGKQQVGGPHTIVLLSGVEHTGGVESLS